MRPTIPADSPIGEVLENSLWLPAPPSSLSLYSSLSPAFDPAFHPATFPTYQHAIRTKHFQSTRDGNFMKGLWFLPHALSGVVFLLSSPPVPLTFFYPRTAFLISPPLCMRGCHVWFERFSGIRVYGRAPPSPLLSSLSWHDMLLVPPILANRVLLRPQIPVLPFKLVCHLVASST